MKMEITDVYELIKEKRHNAFKDKLSKNILSIDNPYIRELKGEIDAYDDVILLIENSGLLKEIDNTTHATEDKKHYLDRINIGLGDESPRTEASESLKYLKENHRLHDDAITRGCVEDIEKELKEGEEAKKLLKQIIGKGLDCSHITFCATVDQYNFCIRDDPNLKPLTEDIFNKIKELL